MNEWTGVEWVEIFRKHGLDSIVSDDGDPCMFIMSLRR